MITNRGDENSNDHHAKIDIDHCWICKDIGGKDSKQSNHQESNTDPSKNLTNFPIPGYHSLIYDDFHNSCLDLS